MKKKGELFDTIYLDDLKFLSQTMSFYKRQAGMEWHLVPLVKGIPGRLKSLVLQSQFSSWQSVSSVVCGVVQFSIVAAAEII